MYVYFSSPSFARIRTPTFIASRFRAMIPIYEGKRRIEVVGFLSHAGGVYPSVAKVDDDAISFHVAFLSADSFFLSPFG